MTLQRHPPRAFYNRIADQERKSTQILQKKLKLLHAIISWIKDITAMVTIKKTSKICQSITQIKTNVKHQ